MSVKYKSLNHQGNNSHYFNIFNKNNNAPLKLVLYETKYVILGVDRNAQL